jgi:hypothetical protein
MSYRFILTLLLVAVSAGTLHAQKEYAVKVMTQPYKDLEPANVIGRGASMAEAYSMHPAFAFAPYDSAFNFATANIIVARNGFLTIDNSRIAWIVDAFLGTYLPIDTSSTMSVQLIGTTPGNRTMKFQWKNMAPADNDEGDFVNFQLWLFEADNSMEVHVGPRHLTSFASWNDSGPPVGMFLSTYSLGTFYHQIYLTGDASHPVGSLEYDDVLRHLDNMPAEGTVYRFAFPQQGAGVERLAARSGISFQPNPAHGTARITLPGELAGKQAVLHLYDALGREVMRQEDIADGTMIRDGDLPAGMYFATLTCGTRRYDGGTFIVR